MYEFQLCLYEKFHFLHDIDCQNRNSGQKNELERNISICRNDHTICAITSNVHTFCEISINIVDSTSIWRLKKLQPKKKTSVSIQNSETLLIKINRCEWRQCQEK